MASPRRPAAPSPSFPAPSMAPVTPAGRSARLFRVLGVLIALMPAALLSSLVAGTRSCLGVRHPVTLAAAALIFGGPLWAALRISRWPAGAARARALDLVLCAASVGIALLSTEAAVRIMGEDPARHPVWRRQTGERMAAWDPALGIFTLRPGARWSHIYSSNPRGYFDSENSVHYRMNSAGFRGAEPGPRRAGDGLRIAFLGDSLGFGDGVKDDDVVTAQIERSLPALIGCPAVVQNFSVPGYGTREEQVVLERTALEYEPDAVIVWYFLNDVQGSETAPYLGPDEPAIFFPILRDVSAAFRLAGERLDARFRAWRLMRNYENSYSEKGEPWRRVVESFRKMGEVSRRRGLPIALFIHPILYKLEEGYPFAAIHEQVALAAKEAGLRPFDLRDAFRGHDGDDLWVHPSDQHPNEIAHALAAAYAAPIVARLLPACGGSRAEQAAQGPGSAPSAVPAAAGGDRIQ